MQGQAQKLPTTLPRLSDESDRKSSRRSSVMSTKTHRESMGMDTQRRKQATHQNIDIFQLVFQEQWKYKPNHSRTSIPQPGIDNSTGLLSGSSNSPYFSLLNKLNSQDLKEIKLQVPALKDPPRQAKTSQKLDTTADIHTGTTTKSLQSKDAVSSGQEALTQQAEKTQGDQGSRVESSVSRDKVDEEESSHDSSSEANVDQETPNVDDIIRDMKKQPTCGPVLQNVVLKRLHSTHKSRSQQPASEEFEAPAENVKPKSPKSRVRSDLQKRLDKLSERAVFYADEAREREIEKEEDQDDTLQDRSAAKIAQDSISNTDSVDNVRATTPNHPNDEYTAFQAHVGDEQYEYGVKQKVDPSVSGWRSRWQQRDQKSFVSDKSIAANMAAKDLIIAIESTPSTRGNELPGTPTQRNGAKFFNKSMLSMRSGSFSSPPGSADGRKESFSVPRSPIIIPPSIDEPFVDSFSTDVEFHLQRDLSKALESSSNLLVVPGKPNRKKSMDSALLRSPRSSISLPSLQLGGFPLPYSGTGGEIAMIEGGQIIGPIGVSIGGLGNMSAIGALVRPVDKEKDWEERESRLSAIANKLSLISEKYWYEDHMRQEKNENAMAKTRKLPWYSFRRNKVLERRMKADKEYVKKRVEELGPEHDPRAFLRMAPTSLNNRSNTGFLPAMIPPPPPSNDPKKDTDDSSGDDFIDFEQDGINLFRNYVKYRATRKGQMYESTTVGRSLEVKDDVSINSRYGRIGSLRKKFSHKAALRIISDKIHFEEKRLGIESHHTLSEEDDEENQDRAEQEQDEQEETEQEGTENDESSDDGRTHSKHHESHARKSSDDSNRGNSVENES